MLNRSYVPGFDGLRAVAVSLVVLTHLSYRIAPGGHVGVDIFFVLSGFLITGVLTKEWEARRSISLRAFYIRRALRLMPALLCMVVCELLISLLFGGPSPNMWGGSAIAGAYLMDVVRAFSSYAELSAVGHTWSLAVEEHFYIVWPLILIQVMALQPRMRTPAVALLAVIVVSWRAWLALNGAGADRIYYSFDTRAEQLLVGCALSMWQRYGQAVLQARIARLWPCAALGVLLITFAGGGHDATIISKILEPSLTSLLSAIIILELARGRGGVAAAVLSWRPFVEFGKRSYGIYLWHYVFLIHARVHSDNKAVALAAVSLAVIVAAMSYKYVELPFLRLKQRFEPDAKSDPSTKHAPILADATVAQAMTT
jgi:peptidoglycan/LPS O-acetylase OafA/YrhL